MTARMQTYYFTFSNHHKFKDFWVEIEAKSSKQACDKMQELYSFWDKCFNEYKPLNYRLYPKGCLARYTIE